MPTATGKLFKAGRAERGSTLEEVGHVLGVNKQSVYAWEQGTAMPSGIKLARLCAMLKIKSSQLEKAVMEDALEAVRRRMRAA